jgi:hypothetical protein
MGKRRREEDKGKEESDDLKGKIKGGALSKSPLLAGLKTASRAVACAPLSPHLWSPRASLVFSVSSLPNSSWTPLSGEAVFLAALEAPGGVRMALVDYDER